METLGHHLSEYIFNTYSHISTEFLYTSHKNVPFSTFYILLFRPELIAEINLVPLSL